MIARRGLFSAGAGLLLAPAIVPAESLMRLPPPARFREVLAEWVAADEAVLARVRFRIARDWRGRWTPAQAMRLEGNALDPAARIIRVSDWPFAPPPLSLPTPGFPLGFPA